MPAGTFTERVAALDAVRRSGGAGAGPAGVDLDELEELARLADRDLDDLDEVDVPDGAGAAATYNDHRRLVRTLDGLTLQVARVLTAWVPGATADVDATETSSAV